MQSLPHKRRGRPRKSENWTPSNLRERADFYFAKCDARTKKVLTKDGDLVEVPNPAPYTMAGLCASLGVTRNAFKKFLDDKTLGDAAQSIHLIVVDNRVTGGLDGSQTASFAQFDLKNIDPEHYQDKTEVKHDVDAAVAGILERSLAQWVPKE